MKKDNFGKNNMRKHCNNSQCFKEKKLQNKIINQLNIKKKSNRQRQF